MVEGTLVWLNEATGYGLIRPDEGGRNLFVYPMDMALCEPPPLEEGTEVAYEVKHGRTMRATKIIRRLRYSWWEACRERLEGKEARNKYYEGL